MLRYMPLPTEMAAALMSFLLQCKSLAFGQQLLTIHVLRNCDYMKSLRVLIQTVADFTSSKLNVIGYSVSSFM